MPFLAVLQQRLLDGNAQKRSTALKMLSGWQQDAYLSWLRDDNRLSSLTAQDRAAWKKFWADAAQLIQKAEAKK